MASEQRAPRLAILIDADNTSARIAKGLFEEIAKIGEASVRRIYGDFSDTRLKTWAAILSDHAILPHQNFANTVGKNATDIALVIDAMDLLHSGRFDGFCLVSSDSDFTRLAARIREHGLDVYGFGTQKTPQSFVRACHKFIYTENLASGVSGGQLLEAKEKPAPLNKPLNEATRLIEKAVEQLEGPDGWVTLSRVGKRLPTLAPDFDQRSYGKSKLGDLVEKCGAFDIRRGEGAEIHIRIKRAAGKAVAGKQKAAPKK
jgi:uncharacterized LabA/DUF88 family protein